MKKFMMLLIACVAVFGTACGRQNLENGMPCLDGQDCISGVCVSNKCQGRPTGSSCTVPGQCVTGQCEGGSCVTQTCNPVCQVGDICLGTAANRCAPASGSYNGENCQLAGDRGCLSLKCNSQYICEPRSDGAYCSQSEQCAAASTCISSSCQPTGSTCSPACSVGQRCLNGTCAAIPLAAKDACVANSNCASGFCDSGPRHYLTCRAGISCTPVCPAASSIACGVAITPTNGCGTCTGSGSYCQTGSCNGTTCVAAASDFTVTSPATIAVQQGLSSTVTITVASLDSSSKTVAMTISGAPTGVTTSYNPSSVTVSGSSSSTSVLTVSVSAAVAVGNYNLTITGTSGSNVRTATLVLTVSASGGTGLPLGSTCTAKSQCASGNCGPLWAATKTCNGTVDIDQIATNAYECHSGVFIAGTTRCGPDQFRLCTNYGGIGVSAWTDTGSGGSFRTGSDGCWVSDPSLNHRSASENGDFSKCVQYTYWTVSNGVTCRADVSSFMAIWNTSRVY